MEKLHRIVCGLDVHKTTITASIRKAIKDEEVQKMTRQFGTMTRQLLELSDWLKENEVKQVAMESTGVYWKPVWNILDGDFELTLVNSQHIKHVPGKKTDMKDSEWIAELLQYGLLPKSFVPDQPMREMRDLTRHRSKLVQKKAGTANRIQKFLEDANIKLACVATDILGVSGRAMLKHIIEAKTTPENMANLAQGRMRSKIPELIEALTGYVNDHHRYMLSILLEELESTERIIEGIEKKLEEYMSSFKKKAVLLMTIPGINKTNACNILAEIGINMDQFPSAGHLSSWAGICPGNNESAGKRKSGKISKGNHWLKTFLTETAWAASRTKNTYLKALYEQILKRRGKKKAIIAVAHSILVICYNVIKYDEPYKELGGDYFINLNPERYKRNYVKKLERLGFQVCLQKKVIS